MENEANGSPVWDKRKNLVVAEWLDESPHWTQIAAEEAGDVERGHNDRHKKCKFDPSDQTLRGKGMVPQRNRISTRQGARPTCSGKHIGVPHDHPGQVGEESPRR